MNNWSVTKPCFDMIIDHMKEQHPLEGCGYLAGKGNTISHFFALENIAHSAYHFRVFPEEQFSTIRSIRNDGLQLIGVVHSHPCGSAVLSTEDILMADDTLLHIVVAINSNIEMCAYRIVAGIPQKITVHIDS